jgi:hypothetical protein
MFKDFCQQVRTKVAFTSVYHPQSNRVVERANALIFETIKKILEREKKGKWAEVMPRAVWSHNTIVYRATNFTPFRLLYGAEAVLPEEIMHQIFRTAMEVSPCPREDEDKDFLESDRLKVVTNLQKYQDETRACRDPNAKIIEFDVGDQLLLRSPRTESSGKLQSKWVGSYVAVKKQAQGPTVSQIPRARSWSILGNADNHHHLYV